MVIYVKMIFYFHIFSFFLVFKRNFIRRADFSRISASNTASDDVTNLVTCRIFNTDLLYYCAHFLVKIDEISSHNGELLYDLMMINNSGLLFGPLCIRKARVFLCSIGFWAKRLSWR